MAGGWRDLDLANPTEEHAMLRDMVRSFVSDEVEVAPALCHGTGWASPSYE